MFHRQPLETDSVEKQSAQTVKTDVKEVDKTMGGTQPNGANSQNVSETRQNDSAGSEGASPPLKMAGAQKPRMPVNFSNAYPGASATTSASGPVGTEYGHTESKRRLVVGQGITLSGEIESCDMLIVEGTVEAALKGASHLDVTESGVFYGTVEIDEATISGRFEGDIVVHGRLTVTETGSIVGSIAYKELSIDAGATVDGKIMPLSSMANSKVVKEKTAKGVAPKNDNKGGDAELPFLQESTKAVS